MQSYSSTLVNPLKIMQQKEELEVEFVESGERERIEEIVVRRLQETGWTRRVEEMCKEYIAKKGCERVELQSMVDDLKDPARRSVPDEVKRELMQLIQAFVNARTAEDGN